MLFDYDPLLQLNAHYLDEIPNFYDRFLKNNNGVEAHEIMAQVQDAYEDNEFDERLTKIFDSSPFDGFVLNYFGDYEFMEYCNDRFGSRWTEEVRYYLWN
jgi:hypothetical protein